MSTYPAPGTRPWQHQIEAAMSAEEAEVSAMETAEQQLDQRTADLIGELRKQTVARDKVIDRLRSELADAKRRAELYLAERNAARAERDDAVREQNRLQDLLDVQGQHQEGETDG